MGFLDDLWEGAKDVGGHIASAVATPFVSTYHFGDDLVSGKNVGESLTGYVARTISGFGSPILQIRPVHDAFNSDFMSNLTAGVSRDFVKLSDYNEKVNYKGNSASFNESRDTIFAGADAGLKIGAAVVVGPAVAGHGAGVGTAVAQYSSARASAGIIDAAEKGNLSAIAQSASTFAPSVGIPPIPPELTEGVNEVRGAIGSIQDLTGNASQSAEQAQAAANAALNASKGAGSLLDLVKSNTPPVTRGVTTTGVAAPAAISGVVILAGLGLAYYLTRGKA